MGALPTWGFSLPMVDPLVLRWIWLIVIGFPPRSSYHLNILLFIVLVFFCLLDFVPHSDFIFVLGGSGVLSHGADCFMLF